MRRAGFSLLEMMVVVLVFTIISGAVFQLLDVAQQRYKMESEFLDSFQGARLALDQITRDIHVAGYPPQSIVPVAVATANPQLVAVPFAWSPGYPGAPCTVNATCAAAGGPAAFDLIIETDIDPQNNNGVEWIRYQLQGTTLMRAVVPKQAGADPAAKTLPALVPYVENVINNDPAQLAIIKSYYPLTFLPGSGNPPAPVPLFTYAFDPPQPGQLANTPSSIREVTITLIVQAPSRDPKTRQFRAVTLSGLARRFNPS